MAWPLGHAWSPSDHPKVKSKQTSKRHPQAALLAEGRTDPGLQWAPEPGPFQGSPAFLLSLSGSLPLAIKKVPRLSISGKSLETHGRHYVPVISWETHQSVPHSSGGDNYTLPSQIYVPILSRLKQRPQGRQKAQCPPPHLTGQHYPSGQLGFLLYQQDLCASSPQLPGYPGHRPPLQLLEEDPISLPSSESRAGRADCSSARTDKSPRLHLHTNPQAASCKLPSGGHQDEKQLPPT